MIHPTQHTQHYFQLYVKKHIHHITEHDKNIMSRTEHATICDNKGSGNPNKLLK